MERRRLRRETLNGTSSTRITACRPIFPATIFTSVWLLNADCGAGFWKLRIAGKFPEAACITANESALHMPIDRCWQEPLTAGRRIFIMWEATRLRRRMAKTTVID